MSTARNFGWSLVQSTKIRPATCPMLVAWPLKTACFLSKLSSGQAIIAVSVPAMRSLSDTRSNGNKLLASSRDQQGLCISSASCIWLAPKRRRLKGLLR